jgi:hypothetical protein
MVIPAKNPDEKLTVSCMPVSSDRSFSNSPYNFNLVLDILEDGNRIPYLSTPSLTSSLNSSI